MNARRPPPSAGAERGPLHRERLLLAVVALAIAAVTAIWPTRLNHPVNQPQAGLPSFDDQKYRPPAVG